MMRLYNNLKRFLDFESILESRMHAAVPFSQMFEGAEDDSTIDVFIVDQCV